MRSLIVNADDFGFSHDVNAGIVHCHREGILTSTTLMANGDAFEDAVRLAHETPSLDIGCHLVLIQGRSLLTGELLPATPRALVNSLVRNRVDVYAELRVQIEKIIAAGIKPTHLDSHKHTHLVPTVFRQVVRLAREFQIPYVRLPFDSSIRGALTFAGWYRRLARSSKVRSTDHFLGFRLTGKLTEETLAPALMALPEGVTEFMCHPGFLGPELARSATRLKESRLLELEALTSSRVRSVIDEQKIRLTPFAR